MQTHAGHTIAFNVFCTLWPCDLYLWSFDLILTDGRGLMMDYPCGMFGDCSFNRFVFIVRTNRQTDRITESQTPLNALFSRLSSAWEIICLKVRAREKVLPDSHWPCSATGPCTMFSARHEARDTGPVHRMVCTFAHQLSPVHIHHHHYHHHLFAHKTVNT